MNQAHGWTHKRIEGQNGRTLLLFHGTGGNEHDLVPFAEFLDPDASVLSLRGRIDENGALRFFRRFSEGVFDLENLRHETEALAHFLIDADREYGIDPTQTIAVGFSNGANMAASVLLRHPERLAGAILLRAAPTFDPDPVPDLRGRRVFIASGERDPMVTRDQADALARLFATSGAQVDHVWVPGGHSLTKRELEQARDWLRALP